MASSQDTMITPTHFFLKSKEKKKKNADTIPWGRRLKKNKQRSYLPDRHGQNRHIVALPRGRWWRRSPPSPPQKKDRTNKLKNRQTDRQSHDTEMDGQTDRQSHDTEMEGEHQQTDVFLNISFQYLPYRHGQNRHVVVLPRGDGGHPAPVDEGAEELVVVGAHEHIFCRRGPAARGAAC